MDESTSGWKGNAGHLITKRFPASVACGDLRPNRPEQVDLEALAGARQLTHLLPEVRALEYAPGSGLRLRHPRGWMVYLGTGEDMAKKVGVLRAMEVEFASEDVVQPTLVDLRFPASPYYRLPDENSPAGAD